MPYTVVNIVETSQSVRPDEEQLRCLFQFLAVSRVDFLTKFGTRRRWDRQARVSQKHEGLSVVEAIELWSKEAWAVAFFHLHFEGWAVSFSSQIANDAKAKSIADGYVPWDMGVYIGGFSISDIDEERTIIDSDMCITIGGDSSPLHSDHYLARIIVQPAMKLLLAYLSDNLGGRWEVLLRTF